MPVETIFVLAGIVAVFAVFAAALILGERTSG